MVRTNGFEEFIGRLGVFYKDGEFIYAYDDISHGLYKFALNSKEVTFILSPVDIHRNTNDRIAGISKSKNEIILIPLYLDSEWIFYDTEREKIRYFSPIKTRVRIADVVTTEKYLFLIPHDIYNSIFIVSLDELKIVRTYDNWYTDSLDKIKNQVSIWGTVLYGDSVFFPVIGTNYICYLNVRELHIISLNVECTILSVGVTENKIWILPKEGEYIYTANFNGEIINRIRLNQEEITILASLFIRIIPIKETVFLLPLNGSYIYVYQCGIDKIIRIGREESPLWGGVFIPNEGSFWNFILENNRLYLLPANYRCRSIDLFTLESISYSLIYGNNIENGKYWKMIAYTQKNCIFREKRETLGEFIKFVCFLEEEQYGYVNAEIGRQIWKRMQ